MQFKSRVSAFLERTGMKPATFGMKALGDPNLLCQIGEGRSPSLRTADWVLSFTVDCGGAACERGILSRFPRLAEGSARAVGCIKSEVDRWIRERIGESRFEGGQAEVLRRGRGRYRAVSWTRSKRPGTSLLGAAKAGKPAYPLSYNGAGEGLAPAPPSNPPLFALPRRSRMGAPPPFPRAGAA